MKSIKFPIDYKHLDTREFTEHSNNISLMVLRKRFDDSNSRRFNKKKFFGYINEEFLTLNLVIELKKHSRMNRIFNIKIDQLIQSGIVKRIVEAQFKVLAKVTRRQNEEEKEEVAERLTMEHLELCFYAFLIGLLLSCIVFFYELVIGLLSSL
jgi:hypothetical protein